MRRLLTAVLVLTALLACSNDPAPAPAADPSAAAAIANRGTQANAWQSVPPRPQWSQFERVDSDDNWFEVYRIREHVYAIYEPGQFEEVISFLILGERTALLFDTGLGFGNIRAVVKALTRLPLLVLNSHHHYDHIGGNYQFAQIIGLNHAYSKQRSAGLAHDVVGEFASPGWLSRKPPAQLNPATYRIKPYQFSHWVTEGEFIDLGGVSLEIIHTPGHAPDAISLLDHANRLLFTGDTFYPGPLYAHLEGSDLGQYQASASKLATRAEQVDFLITSHNVPLASSRKLVDLEQALADIASGKATFEPSDGGREYSFDGFSILTHDPPL